MSDKFVIICNLNTCINNCLMENEIFSKKKYYALFSNIDRSSNFLKLTLKIISDEISFFLTQRKKIY